MVQGKTYWKNNIYFVEILYLLNVIHCSSSIMLFNAKGYSIWGLWRKSKIYPRPLSIFCLFIKIYWCVGENILKYYWSGSIVILKTSPTNNILVCFHLNCMKNDIRTVTNKSVKWKSSFEVCFLRSFYTHIFYTCQGFLEKNAFLSNYSFLAW